LRAKTRSFILATMRFWLSAALVAAILPSLCLGETQGKALGTPTQVLADVPKCAVSTKTCHRQSSLSSSPMPSEAADDTSMLGQLLDDGRVQVIMLAL